MTYILKTTWLAIILMMLISCNKNQEEYSSNTYSNSRTDSGNEDISSSSASTETAENRAIPPQLSLSDRYLLNSDGSITDVVTDLEWMVGPDNGLDWDVAADWVTSLGAGWRMATINELEALFYSGINDENWGPFQNTGYKVWSADICGTSHYMNEYCYLYFDTGEISQKLAERGGNGDRVFAVR